MSKKCVSKCKITLRIKKMIFYVDMIVVHVHIIQFRDKQIPIKLIVHFVEIGLQGKIPIISFFQRF